MKTLLEAKIAYDKAKEELIKYQQSHSSSNTNYSVFVTKINEFKQQISDIHSKLLLMYDEVFPNCPKRVEIAKGLSVKLNKYYMIKCIGDEFLSKEDNIIVSSNDVMNDKIGPYVHIQGASGVTSGYAYLFELSI